MSYGTTSATEAAAEAERDVVGQSLQPLDPQMVSLRQSEVVVVNERGQDSSEEEDEVYDADESEDCFDESESGDWDSEDWVTESEYESDSGTTYYSCSSASSSSSSHSHSHTTLNGWDYQTTPTPTSPFIRLANPFAPSIACQVRLDHSQFPCPRNSQLGGCDEVHLCAKQLRTPVEVVDHFLEVHVRGREGGFGDDEHDVGHIEGSEHGVDPASRSSAKDKDKEDWEWECTWGSCHQYGRQSLHGPETLIDHIRSHLTERILCTRCGGVFGNEEEARVYAGMSPLHHPSGSDTCVGSDADMEMEGEGKGRKTVCDETREREPVKVLEMWLQYGFWEEAREWIRVRGGGGDASLALPWKGGEF